MKLSEKSEKRLKKLKDIVNDERLDELLIQVVSLEDMLDELKDTEKIHHNPNNAAQIKINPAFYAYHKTLSAYKECIKLLLTKCADSGEDSPLRAYLKSLNTSDEFVE